jgi:hypothetical protein
MNSHRILTAAVLMVLLVASSAAAAGPGPGSKGDWKQTVQLQPTKFAQKDTFGYCTIKSDHGVEMLGVRVFGDMPDDSLLIVQVVTKEGTFDVGTIKMFLGSGSLILYSTFMPSPAFPLANVQAVIVRDVHNQLLGYNWAAAALPSPK